MWLPVGSPCPTKRKRFGVSYEGELFNYPELRPQLLERGHRLLTNCDTEAWAHLYEDHGEGVFAIAEGQFGLSLWDRPQRTLFLGRDRAGIAPLYVAEVDGWLLWGSEIKALLASGMIEARPDRRGIDYFFNFFAMSNERTCFEGISSIRPGQFLKIRDGHIERRQYWDLDYPDAGQERRFARPEDAVDEFEDLLRGAIRRRLVGEMPICTYISGGLDSTMVLGLCGQEFGQPIPSLTIGLDHSGPADERTASRESAETLKSPLVEVAMSPRDIADAYPDLVRAAEAPVLDTSAACMIRLAQAARQEGHIGRGDWGRRG